MNASALSDERTVTVACGRAVDYRVRRSPRARRVRLTVSARDGLVVTLPRGLAEDHARRAVLSRQEWALGALSRVAARRALSCAPAAERLPDEVALAALGRTLPVTYRSGGSRSVAREAGGELVVSAPGGRDDAESCLAALRRWHARAAREALPPLLDRVAAEAGTRRPARVTVRGQRTRWGSCSHSGTVSLNRDLLFLPPHLVRYVLVHELAHLTHLDHSPRFWRLVDRLCLDPSAEECRASLRAARETFVPVWADA